MLFCDICSATVLVLVYISVFLFCLNANSKRGSIEISTKQDLQAQTVVPDVDMDIAVYVMYGTDKRNSFTKVTTENNVVVDNLALGEWIIVVCARNAEAEVIGRGLGVTTVYDNIQSQLNVAIKQSNRIDTLCGCGYGQHLWQH